MYTMSQLVEQTGYPERTIRNYIQQGVLPDIERKDGLYGEDHVRLLLAIGLLQEQGIRRHDELRVRLAAMSPDQLVRFIGEVDDEQEPPEAEATMTVPVAMSTPSQPPPLAGDATREEWERIVLAPGLELHVRRDATAEVRRVAEEIVRAGGR